MWKCVGCVALRRGEATRKATIWSALQIGNHGSISRKGQCVTLESEQPGNQPAPVWQVAAAGVASFWSQDQPLGEWPCQILA